MPLKIVLPFRAFLLSSCVLLPGLSLAAGNTPKTTFPLSTPIIIKELGWVETGENRCGGYYVDAPFLYPEDLKKNKLIITSNQFLFAQKGTSYGQGKVTITRYGQQIIANRAFIFRDPATSEIRSIELLDNVTLREPNSLVMANQGSYDLKTKAESLHDILYRTTIYNTMKFQTVLPSNAELQVPRKIFQLSAWGEAKKFIQDKPKVYEFDEASYSTCPPTRTIWQVKAKHLELNQETGRGYATHARILFKGFPVLYSPYINFPIDARRQTGFLWPAIERREDYGTGFSAPFYWNMAPNYDMTITPTFLSKRVQLSDLFRYLTPTSQGSMTGELFVADKVFADFQHTQKKKHKNSTDPVTQSELNDLTKSSDTRKAFSWQNHTRFNEHWTSNLNYNWVSDDYYLRNFSNNLNQITQNQLLQEGEVNYKGQNWEATGRIQGYKTLHPVDEPNQFDNQYTRLPQLIFNGYYPDNPGNFEYFVQNELTHFNITPDPGSTLKYPIGNRLYTQPGLSRPISLSYLTITPRLQFSMTQYEVGNVTGNTSKDPSRALPIFDLNSMSYFDRNMHLFGQPFRQTLEPQLYYVYIPYRNQTDIPLFDTTVNTLNYDQLFLYNRFSGIDRLNDANRLTVGVTTRFIDPQSGAEKIKAGIGEILYFKKRSVTLCADRNDPFCPYASTDYPGNPDNLSNHSPISGLLNYTVNPSWAVNGNAIYNTQTNQLDNESVILHFQPAGTQKIINAGYNFVRDGDILPGDSLKSGASNLSSTDLSMSWPVPFIQDWSITGRWTQNWNHHHLQNLLYGLQYDSCCWAIRFVTGRVFTHINADNTFRYNDQLFFQIALKGLGTVPVSGGDPSQLLANSISGYQNNFGRDF